MERSYQIRETRAINKVHEHIGAPPLLIPDRRGHVFTINSQYHELTYLHPFDWRKQAFADLFARAARNKDNPQLKAAAENAIDALFETEVRTHMLRPPEDDGWIYNDGHASHLTFLQGHHPEPF